MRMSGGRGCNLFRETAVLMIRYLFDLDGWQIAHPPEGLRRIDPRLADLAEAAELRAKVTLQNAGLDSDAAYNAYSGELNDACGDES